MLLGSLECVLRGRDGALKELKVTNEYVHDALLNGFPMSLSCVGVSEDSVF